jgi:hypothetical protein
MKPNSQTTSTKHQLFEDLSISLQFGAVKADRRVQVKMPDIVVQELDRLFPDTDRSLLLTKLAVEAILHHLRFSDRPDLGDLTHADQAGLDTMYGYLETRDA